MRAYNLEDAVQHSEKITSLCIHMRGLKKIPSIVFSLPLLRRLELSQNQLHEIPDSILQLQQLEEIILPNNQIQEIPSFLNQLSNLRILNLCGNQISNWPVFDSHFPSLETLDLSKNKIYSLSDSLSANYTLKNLNLNQNQLDKIPNNIGLLKGLCKFSIANNQLRQLPDSILNCKQLRALDVSHNKIKSFPSSVNSFEQLNKMDASSNQVTELPQFIEQCCYLTNLNFSNNKITKVNLDFTALKYLRTLHLSKNQLSAISDLGPLLQLRHLDLSKNKIVSLPQGIEYLNYLEQLNLKQNPIKGFPRVLLNLSKLRQVSGLEPQKINKRILRFSMLCRKKNISKKERDQLFPLLQNIEKKHSLNHLLLACSIGLPSLTNNAIEQIILQYGKPIEDYPISKNTLIGILGKASISLKALKQLIDQKGGILKQGQVDNCSHIILGKQIPLRTILPDKKYIFIKSEELLQWQRANQSDHLKTASPKQLTRITQLLRSQEESNLKIVLQILKGRHIPKVLYTEVFIVWKTIDSGSLKNNFGNLLKQNADPTTLKVLSFKLSLSKKLSIEERRANIQKYSTGALIEEKQLINFFIPQIENG